MIQNNITLKKINSSPYEADSVEITLLCALLFFLPLYEAPKNLILYAYLIYWLFRRFKLRTFGHSSRVFEAPLITIGLLGFVTTLINLQTNTSSELLVEARNHSGYWALILVAICISRTSWKSANEVGRMFLFLIAGVTTAIIEGALRGGDFPSMKSVGHINQVANFLAIVFSIFISLFFVLKKYRYFTFTLSILIIILILETNSRNALFASFLTLLCISVLRAKLFKWSSRALILIPLVLSVGVAFVVANPSAIQKQRAHLEAGSLDGGRIKLWTTALITMHNKPLFGYGPDQFAQATSEKNIKSIVESNGEKYSADNYLFTSHAHNLWVHFAVERGLIATLTLIFWQLSLFRFLYLKMTRPKICDKHEYQHSAIIPDSGWVMIGFSVLFVSVFAGIGNTTLRHEHGLLVFIALGFVLSFLKKNENANN